jgi:hypothetical protein
VLTIAVADLPAASECEIEVKVVIAIAISAVARVPRLNFSTCFSPGSALGVDSVKVQDYSK